MCCKVTLFFAKMKAFAKKLLKFVTGTTFFNYYPYQKT